MPIGGGAAARPPDTPLMSRQEQRDTVGVSLTAAWGKFDVWRPHAACWRTHPHTNHTLTTLWSKIVTNYVTELVTYRWTMAKTDLCHWRCSHADWWLWLVAWLAIFVRHMFAFMQDNVADKFTTESRFYVHVVRRFIHDCTVYSSFKLPIASYWSRGILSFWLCIKTENNLYNVIAKLIV